MSEEVTSEQAESLYNEVSSQETHRGFADDEAQAPNLDPEFEINWKGEAKKLPLSKIRDYAQQGFDYSQKMSEINKMKFEFEKKQKEFEERYSRFSELDKYVIENPSWWDHVNKSYQSKGQVDVAPTTERTLTTDPVKNELFESLKNEIDGFKSFKQSVEEERAQAAKAKEDQKYSQDVEGLQKAYPDIDFAKPDESGFSLEYQVLKHANDNGIKSFKTAFLDFYHDTLMKRAELKAKETLSKDLQATRKLGLTQSTEKAPVKKSSGAVTGRTYEDLKREAMEEYGLT
jgi:hypothetical protein